MLHVLNERASLTSSELGLGLIGYNFSVDAHMAFATMLASDPEVIRTRSSTPSAATGLSGIDIGDCLAFIDFQMGRTAATVVEALSAAGLIRSLHSAALPVGSTATPALVGAHAAVRQPLYALRTLLLHGGQMQHMPVSRYDNMFTAAPASVPTTTINEVRAIYERIFFPLSQNASGAVSLYPWEQLLLHPGLPSTFTGRILGLRAPEGETYWRYHTLHPGAAVVDDEPSLIRDIIKMELLRKGDKLADPERLKSNAIDANQLDREDQSRATAEMLAAHGVAIGLLQYIVTDCYFEALLQTPWLKPIFRAALDRISLTERFDRATAEVAPFRKCGGCLTELWARFNPTSASIPRIMDKTHPIYCVPEELYQEMFSHAYPASSAASAASAMVRANTTPLNEPSRRGTSAAAYRINETSLLSPLGIVPGGTYLDQFVETRLALADILGGQGETRTAQALTYVLAQLGWTTSPAGSRVTPPTLFGAPIQTDGVYTSAPIDAVDFRAERTIRAIDAATVPTIVTSGSNRLKRAYYESGFPVLRPVDAQDLGMPAAEDPRDYAALLPMAGTHAIDFDADARIIPNTVDEWARILGLTVVEFNAIVLAFYDKWVHLFSIVNGVPIPKTDLAITSSKVARLSRSTIIVGVPGGTTLASVDHFADPVTAEVNGITEAQGIVDQVLRNQSLQGDYCNEWSGDLNLAGVYGSLTGEQNAAAPGPLSIFYVDAADPAKVRLIATWAPPVVVADPALFDGSRSDMLDTNITLTKRVS